MYWENKIIRRNGTLWGRHGVAVREEEQSAGFRSVCAKTFFRGKKLTILGSSVKLVYTQL